MRAHLLAAASLGGAIVAPPNELVAGLVTGIPPGWSGCACLLWSLLTPNGRGSSSKRTTHIDIRYFFVTDRVRSGEVSVKYCPTGEMIADYFSKPLQGSLFCKFCNFILNITE